MVRIPVEQWGIGIHKSQAEKLKIKLKREGLLDTSLKPRHEEDQVIFPILHHMRRARRVEFEAHRIPETLPRHELIGGIAIMLDDEPEEAEHLLRSRPSLHTVLYPRSSVEGDYRTRQFTVLAGKPTTKTRYQEYGLRFEIDLGIAYFSARLSQERQRITEQMVEGEIVLDMFAGVGPFAITCAEKAAVVYAADINPAAIRLMRTNILLNGRRNVVPMLVDSCHLGTVFPRQFNRIIMNFPTNPLPFLNTACSLCRNGGWIHFYVLQGEESEFLTLLQERTGGSIVERYVRSYSPSLHHAVYDIHIQ